jgi:peptide/nickel transport system substrate-binding protein
LCALAAGASTRPQYGGTLHVETQAAPDALVRTLVFDTLTRTDASGEPAPSLAVRWTADNNAQRWQFWLRAGVRFHGGTGATGTETAGAEMTADDVVRSLNEACAAECPWKTLRAVGMSVVMTTDSPAPTMPAELARAMCIVTHKDAAGAADGTGLEGTGPFRVTSQSRDTAMLAAVNDAWAGRPFVDAVEIDGRRDVRAQLLDLSVGRADIVDLPPEAVRQAMQVHLTVVASAPVDMVALILHSRALETPVKREAIADAVDRAAIWSVIYQKQGESSASLLPNALTGYGFLFSTQRNLQHATELAAAVHAPLTLATEANDATMQLVAERLALNLREAGLNVQLRTSGIAANPQSADMELRRVHLEAGDARAGLHEMLRAFGKDMDDGAGDPAALYRAEKAFLDDHTVVPLLWLPRTMAVSARVRRLALAPDGMPLLADVFLKVDQP